MHHTEFPVAQTALRDEALERLVDQVRQVVSLGRAARNQAAIRVRQPLASVRVAVPTGWPSWPMSCGVRSPKS